MKVSELIGKLKLCDPNAYVAIPIDTMFIGLGGCPSSGIARVDSGFDWDQGTVFISPEHMLCESNEQFKQAQKVFRRMQNLSWSISVVLKGTKQSDSDKLRSIETLIERHKEKRNG